MDSRGTGREDCVAVVAGILRVDEIVNFRLLCYHEGTITCRSANWSPAMQIVCSVLKEDGVNISVLQFVMNRDVYCLGLFPQTSNR